MSGGKVHSPRKSFMTLELNSQLTHARVRVPRLVGARRGERLGIPARTHHLRDAGGARLWREHSVGEPLEVVGVAAELEQRVLRREARAAGDAREALHV